MAAVAVARARGGGVPRGAAGDGDCAKKTSAPEEEEAAVAEEEEGAPRHPARGGVAPLVILAPQEEQMIEQAYLEGAA